MTRSSSFPRQPLFLALSLSCMGLALTGGCDTDTANADAADDSQNQLRLEDLTDNIELPDDETIEPTGQSCAVWDAGAPCLDPSSAAFCGVYTADNTLEFGACLPLAELECVPGETKLVQTDTPCGELEAECTAWDGVPAWESPACNEGGDTPLVLLFDAGPVMMIDAEATPAASFDIAMASDESSCIATDWPTAATPWLAVDLDHSGSIEGGHELFGSGSRLADGSGARNGFLALAAYDDNHDGQVDALDASFDQLLVWRDHDADRLSGPGELETLREAGIESLAVHYAVDRRCDARGNCEIERAGFRHAGGRGELVDMHLACQ